MTTKKLLQGEALQKKSRLVETLNLEPIIVKLMDTDEGEGWSLDQCQEAEKWYKRFLLLHILYPDTQIVPHKQIDIFWHYHILDTMKYQQDCRVLFGHFLHHFPYFGLRGEEDARKLKIAYESTMALFASQFNETPQKMKMLLPPMADCSSGCDTGPGSCHVSCYGSCHSEPVAKSQIIPSMNIYDFSRPSLTANG